MTHRAVAAEAGVPLSATTYWFDSREELLEETLRFAAREETERLERIVLDLAPRELDVRGWAEALSELLISEIEAEPERHMALYELGIEAARNPALRPEVERMHAAQLKLAELGRARRRLGRPRGRRPDHRRRHCSASCSPSWRLPHGGTSATCCARRSSASSSAS